MKSWTKSLFAGGLLWIILAGGAAGDQFGDGWAALTRHDYATAMRLLRPLAEAGNAQAQFGVAILYNDGLGVRKDHLQGARWYLKSADQGYSGAQYDLGMMYDLGQGVPQDYVRAYMWLDLAASISRPDDFMIEKRDEVAAKMTPDQIAEAQRMAREWKPD